MTAPTVPDMIRDLVATHPHAEPYVLDRNGETWRPVVGYEGSYEVSDLGRVRSLKYGTPKVMRGGLTPFGYPKVCLSLDGKARNRPIHALVAEAFIGPRPEGMEVCHWDGNKTNAQLTNLRYGTRSDNMQDALRHGTQGGLYRPPTCKAGHEYTPDNTRIYHPKDKPGYKRECRACDARRKREARGV